MVSSKIKRKNFSQIKKKFLFTIKNEKYNSKTLSYKSELFNELCKELKIKDLIQNRKRLYKLYKRHMAEGNQNSKSNV